MKKSAKVLLYFGLDCGMLKFFTLKPQSKEQLMSLPNFWSTVRRKRSRFEHIQTVIRKSRMLVSFLHEAAQNFELKYSRWKIINPKPIAVDALFKPYPLVTLSCRSNLAADGTFKRGIQKRRILLKIYHWKIMRTRTEITDLIFSVGKHWKNIHLVKPSLSARGCGMLPLGLFTAVIMSYIL